MKAEDLYPDLSLEEQEVAQRVLDAPIKDRERTQYLILKNNADLLRDDVRADYHSLDEDDFIRKVVRRPMVGIALVLREHTNKKETMR